MPVLRNNFQDEQQGLRKGLPLGAFASVILAAMVLWFAWSANQHYQLLMQHEYAMLDQRAKEREARISGMVRSVNLMMDTLMEDLHSQPRLTAEAQGKMFRNYLRQLPELRNIGLVDANGMIRANDRDIAVGSDVSERDYFRHHRSAPNSSEVYFPRPFQAKSGLVGTVMTRALSDNNGDLQGVLVASIDNGFLTEVMMPPSDQSGLEALLINTQGDILSRAPNAEHVGDNLLGGIAYTEHTLSEQEVTRHLNIVKFEPVKRMSVFRNVRGGPYTVIVSQQHSAILTQWMQGELGNAVRFAFLAFTTLFFIALHRADNTTWWRPARKLKSAD